MKRVKRSVSNVIFDLDGTLVDSAPGIEFAAQTAWADVVPDRSCPPMRPLMGPPIREMFRRALPIARPKILDALEKGFRQAYDTVGWKKTLSFPHVRETLTALTEQGVRCFGVTNKPASPTQQILAHCGLDWFFDVFLSPDSRQPAFTSKVAATQTLLNEWRIEPAHACFIGDTVDDARAARSCGIAFLAHSGGYGWAELAVAVPRLKSFADFRALPARLLTGQTRAALPFRRVTTKVST